LKVEIAPSILSADFARLAEEVAEVEAMGCRYLHLDVMDGHFVPNLTIGPVVVKSLRPHSKMIFDTHLMIDDPLFYAPRFAEAGSDLITFHWEVAEDPRGMAREIRSIGAQVGMSLNPGTPLEPAALEMFPQLDLLLLMTVNPGFAGQSFMAEVLPKIKQAREYIDVHGLNTVIQVDGGIAPDTAEQAIAAGAEILVMGSALFGSEDRRGVLKAVQTIAAELSKKG